MARLIQKPAYIKAGKAGGYMKYIATRERVEKIEGSGPATEKQRQLIEELLRDYPDAKDTFEYEDYAAAPTVSNASSLITMALDTHASEVQQRDGYMRYIALRPRAERHGEHGLFGRSKTVSLDAALKELEAHDGNVWTIIYSIRREDAARLGYDHAEGWRGLLRRRQTDLAAALKIQPDRLHWYAAFHDEGEHPHVHVMAWSDKPDEGYLSKDGLLNIQSKLTNDIFHGELQALYEREIEQGFVIDNRQTFAEYAKYVLDMKTQGGAKHNTIREYEFLLKRINESMIGSLKLTEIRPQHLNMFYKELQAEGTRDEEMKAKAKARLRKELDERLISHASLSSAAHISHTTTAIACRGETISESSARAIAQALDCNVRDLFTLTKNNRPLSSKTILEHHRLIHTILDMAEREMLIPYNAAEKAIPPKYRRKTPNYFQPEQIVDILSALDQEPIKWQALTHLLLVTGCRRGEIAALKWTKIDLDAARIEISANLCYSAQQGTYETTTKTEATRYIKIPAETVELLKRYRVAQAEHRLACGDRWQNSAYVFTQETGGPMNPTSITAYLRKFSERYGLPHINPHAFRHTVASVLIANGTDIVTVSKQLGHAQVSTTSDVYSHVIEAAKAEATECIADVLLRRKQA